MLHKSTKIIAAISGIIFIVSVGAWARFLYKVVEQKSVFAERNIEYAQEKSHQKALETLAHTLDDTKSARESLNTRILKDDSVIDLLALIESIGKEQGIELSTNSLSVQPIDDIFETLVINVSVKGPYDSVIYMLKLLEHIPYQASVEKVQVGKEGEVSNAVWNGQFEVKVTKFKKI